MKKMLFILFIGVGFVGCEETPATLNEELSRLDKLKLAKEERDNEHLHRNEDYEGWETFIDEYEEIIISYPSDWKQQLGDEEIVVIAREREDSTEKVFRENFHLIIEELEDTFEAKDIANQFFIDQQNLYTDMGKFKLLYEGFVGENYTGENWYLEYEIERENKANMYSVSMFFCRGKRLYALNFYTVIERKEKYDKVFDKIIRSFGW